MFYLVWRRLQMLPLFYIPVMSFEAVKMRPGKYNNGAIVSLINASCFLLTTNHSVHYNIPETSLATPHMQCVVNQSNNTNILTNCIHAATAFHGEENSMCLHRP